MQHKDSLDFESFKPKLGDWAEKLRPFIEGQKMWDIMQKIKKDSISEVIVPKSSDTFRAFRITKPSDVKVIFYLMDPYPRKYPNGEFQATGIAMDCSNSPDGKLQPSLVNWYDAIDKELGVKVNRSKSLDYLHEQGVMLLNTDLTCKLNKTQSHEKLWEPFHKYFLEEVLGADTQIIYVLCGKASLRMEKYINPFCKIYKLTHPAAAAHTNTEWDSEGVFKQINQILKDNNNFEVFWNKDDWDEYLTPPF
jgi:uracil-DNA glycosylase